MRLTLSFSSSRARLNACISRSIRERAIASSPASLTKRSIMSAFTRSSAWRSRPSSLSPSATISARAAASFAMGAGSSSGTSRMMGISIGAASSPLPKLSIAVLKRSSPSSTSSNLRGAGVASASMLIILASSTWASSPKRIRPAMREEPFKVCR